MLNIPALKFEKSIKYLDNELSIQNSNRELLLDVIANINLISKKATKAEKDRLESVSFEANDLLSQSSNMISDLEHLKLEIETITKELNNVLGDKNLKTRTKEYFIATFSDIKKKITIYTVKFKDVETNVKVQNERVNNFIKSNNLQYNFESTESNDAEEIKFADFSMDNGDTTFSNVENTEEVVENVEEAKVEESNTVENDAAIENTEAVSVEVPQNEDENAGLSNEQVTTIDNLTSEFKTLITEVAKGNVTEDITPIIMSYFKQFDTTGSIVEPTVEDNNSVDVEEVSDEEVSDEEVVNENYFNTNIIDELRNMITTGISNLERDIEQRTATNTNSIEDISEDFVDASTDAVQQEELNAAFMNEIISANELVENEINNDEDSDVSQEDDENVVEDIIEDNQVEETVTDVVEDVNNDNQVEETASDVVEDVNNDSQVEETVTDVVEDVNDDKQVEDVAEEVVENDDFEIETESNETVEPVISFVDDDDVSDDEDVHDDESDEESTTTVDLSSYDDNYMIQIDKDTNYQNIFTFNSLNLTQVSNDVVKYDDIVDTPVEVVNTNTETFDTEVSNEEVSDVETSDIEENIDDESLLEALIESEQNVENTENEVTENVVQEVQESDEIPFEEETSPDIKIDFYQKSEFDDLYEKIAKIRLAQADNEALIISKEHGIILPYKLTELKEYMDSYPGLYASFTDVVEQEFILPYNYFSANEKKCRFDEAYNLMKNKEGASAIAAYKYAKSISKENELHPAIVAACRNQRELDAYLYYMQEGELDKFKYFNIYYDE